VYTEEERQIFRFTLRGEPSPRLADPLAVRRALLRHSGGEFYRWRGEIAEPAADETPGPAREGPGADMARASATARLLSALDAQERVAGCVRAAFALPGLDGGCTEADCWNVLFAFEEWLEKNASAAAGSPTTLPAASRPEPAGT
jgi:hypothetical protein